MTDHFIGHYVDWREKRIKKIESIFGKDFFKDKKILELAAGTGHTGQYFESLGAIVTCSDGRHDNLIALKNRYQPNGGTILLDQDGDWQLPNKYDLIIHWGVLYHLNNWQADLKSALNHSNLILLESEASDSDDPNFEIKVDEPNVFDQALHKIGTRPSAAMIEKELSNLGATFIRYDDADINSGCHFYDWKINSSNNWKDGMRRFWIVKK
jgi:hypothetical protein